MVDPPPARRRSTQPLVPADEAASAEDMLADEPWQPISWRQGIKGALCAEFAARRVRIADGPAVRLHGRNNQLTRNMLGEARMVKRAFGVGADAMTDAVQFINERRGRQAA